MSAKRYKHEFQKASGSREMVEDEDGDWVQYEDYENLLAAFEATHAELLALKNSVR